MKVIKEIGPPKGLRRLIFRIPIHLYHMRLGWMFGDRLMLLHHVGRISGMPREVVLEVAEHDAEADSFVVASGWGPNAAWYRNVLQRPEVTIDVGRRSIAVTALPLAREEGAEIFVRYASRRAHSPSTSCPSLWASRSTDLQPISGKSACGCRSYGLCPALSGLSATCSTT